MDYLRQLQELREGLSEMVEGGRLTQGAIPDDFAWLTAKLNSLKAVSAEDIPVLTQDGTGEDFELTGSPRVWIKVGLLAIHLLAREGKCTITVFPNDEEADLEPIAKIEVHESDIPMYTEDLLEEAGESGAE